ncbi:hypothetical protein [Herbiconiux sp. A18JL235]|uniref:Uncharacterized protein n=1 Tax=Herbiconiux sp. A18JL235 TaxID=3152363 RepID=A0AB39BEM1_9MICO
MSSSTLFDRDAVKPPAVPAYALFDGRMDVWVVVTDSETFSDVVGVFFDELEAVEASKRALGHTAIVHSLAR